MWTEKTAKFSHYSACEAFRVDTVSALIILTTLSCMIVSTTGVSTLNNFVQKRPRSRNVKKTAIFTTTRTQSAKFLRRLLRAEKYFPTEMNAGTRHFRRIVAVGSKTFVFNLFLRKNACFDVDENEWSFVESLYLDQGIYCVKTKFYA